VTFRSRLTLAALIGVSLTPVLAARAAEPPAEPQRLAPVPAQSMPEAFVHPNQRTADAIAEQLRQNGQLRHYSLDVTCRDGVAWISGTIIDQPQREEVLRIVRGVPAVDRVVDRMTVATPIERVQAQLPPTQFQAPDPTPVLPGGPAVPPGAHGGDSPANAKPIAEPAPIFQAPPPSPYDLNPPRMPPYAWPTYAPYNNFSRVAIPEAYPYNAFPFIGPCYPFPKVPLGWRSVKLQWDDGHWWYSKMATQYDWWRLRFW
jgi:BON domain-containing protein